MPIAYTCLNCGKAATCAPRQIKRGGGKYCSRKCTLLATQGTAERSPRWKGGATYVNGYRYVPAPGHPRAEKNGKVPEHWLVLEAKLGRYLEPGEQVHHINKIRDDNRPENLVVVATKDHNRLYHSDGQWLTCKVCGKEYWRTPCSFKNNKTGITACSHRCAAILRHRQTRAI